MRRFKRSFGMRSAREPRVWVRNRAAVAAGSILDSIQNVTLFDPTAVVAGSVDTRLTAMRTIISFSDAMDVVTLNTAVTGDVFEVSEGVCFCGVSDVTNPSLTTTPGKETDWLWLRKTLLFAVTGSTIYTGKAPNHGPRGYDTNTLDIIAKRKVDQQEILRYSVILNSTAINGSGHTLSAAARTVVLSSSVLFQRTRR